MGNSYYGIITCISSWCLIDFFFECTRLVNWKASNNGTIVTTLIVDAILLPVWLFWLGVHLRKISLQGGVYTNHVSDSSSPRTSTKPASPTDVELGAVSETANADPMAE